jgi:murein DD-endopeptidase MepM/ murein hydrolase activator NlpD
VRASVRWCARVLSLRRLVVLAVLALAGVAASGITPDTTLDAVPTVDVVRALPVPALVPARASDDAYWREERVQPGDTIGALLARAGIEDADALTFLRTDPAARPLYQLKPGRPLQVATDAAGHLAALRFLAADGRLLAIARAGSAFAAQRAAPPDDVRVDVRVGAIDSSLFGAADAAGLPDAVTLALADIFGGDIDFYHDLRRGDRFAVVYETRYADGEPVVIGRILAAEFVNRGTTYRALLWRAPDGSESYYDEGGRSARKAFLRSPVELSRITSGFTLARFHPILQTWRAHKGTDFAAPLGTPVRATADGEVVFAGTQNGYGNVVILRHDASHTTLYAHLSRFAAGLVRGHRVRQGEAIAFVGQTGWATGPHLHYEFRVADVPRDPMTVALPNAVPIAPAQRGDFLAATAPLLQQMEVVRMSLSAAGPPQGARPLGADAPRSDATGGTLSAAIH